MISEIELELLDDVSDYVEELYQRSEESQDIEANIRFDRYKQAFERECSQYPATSYQAKIELAKHLSDEALKFAAEVCDDNVEAVIWLGKNAKLIENLSSYFENAKSAHDVIVREDIREVRSFGMARIH